MKKLSTPVCDDLQNVVSLANNIALKASYPHIQEALPQIAAQYENYVTAHGNAWNINSIPMSPKLKTGLISHYNNPPKELNFIKSLRDTDDDICPMCGSKFPFTLDHIMPKDDYPEFSVFSKNLVPACRCNGTRGKALKGNPATLERVLHPYFDSVFVDRQLSCLISSTNNFDWITLEVIYLNNTHPQIDAIKFHIEKIVKRAGLEKYLRITNWGKLTIRPSKVIKSLSKKQFLSVQEVADYIQDDLDWYDENSGTPNNWDSIFLHGLIHSPGVVEWITKRHNESV